MKKEDIIGFVIFVAICTFIGAVFLYLSAPAASKSIQNPETYTSEPKTYTPPDPCGLWNVVCEGEVLREITAFTSRPEETDSSPFITADGTDLRTIEYMVCAANFVPFGTVLAIDHIGECVVHDRLSSRFPERVDVYFGTDVDAAIKFGIQKQYVSTR